MKKQAVKKNPLVLSVSKRKLIAQIFIARGFSGLSEFVKRKKYEELSRKSVTELRGILRARNPAPTEWDDDVLNEASRLGSQQARALGRLERESRSQPRYFRVTWYSQKRGGRTGFVKPIEAHSAAEAKRQAKAMITNEKGVSNFVAKEVSANPKSTAKLSAQRQKLYREVTAMQNWSRKLRKAGRDREADQLWTKAERLMFRVMRSGSQSEGPVGKLPNPGNDSSVRSPTRTSTEVKSPTKTSTSTWANTRGNITVTGGAGAGATTRVTVRRNPQPTARALTLAREHSAGYHDTYYEPGCVRCEQNSRTVSAASMGGNSLDKRMRAAAAKRKRKNPSVRELAETFQGKASGAVSEYKAASSAPADLARIGKLVFLKLRDVRKQIAAPGAMVAVDTRGRLWIVGKASLFANKAKPGTLNDFGEIDKICYLTAKAHIENGEITEYVHTFGEDGGKRPRLLIDSEGMPILRGGDYKIKAEGIVN